MPGTAVGLFMIDFVFRPVAKVFEKMPLVIMLFLLILYGSIGYAVLKSAYMSDHHY